jgi:adenosylcobinamide-GDP ribazoletransferase
MALNKEVLTEQVAQFVLALSFFSRLPVGQLVTYSHSRMHNAGRYFPLVGWLLAGILCLAYALFSTLFPVQISVFIIMVISVLLTGAFHEDGLADTADAFGGGQDPNHKLTIMKDSRLGTYGVCALIGALVGKWLLLTELTSTIEIYLPLLIAYPLSRAFALSHVQDLPYAVADVTHSEQQKPNKSMPFSTPYSQADLAFMFISGALMLLALTWLQTGLILASCCVLRLFLKQRMKKHIQGFTGDTLGGAQQLQELLIYVLLLATTGASL